MGKTLTWDTPPRAPRHDLAAHSAAELAMHAADLADGSALPPAADSPSQASLVIGHMPIVLPIICTHARYLLGFLLCSAWCVAPDACNLPICSKEHATNSPHPDAGLISSAVEIMRLTCKGTTVPNQAEAYGWTPEAAPAQPRRATFGEGSQSRQRLGDRQCWPRDDVADAILTGGSGSSSGGSKKRRSATGHLLASPLFSAPPLPSLCVAHHACPRS